MTIASKLKLETIDNELKGNINCKETNDVIDFSIEKNESAINLIHFYKSLKCNYFMQIFE